MIVCEPDEIIIHGTTSKGKVFRPSDWAERLCGILSSFNKDNRLSYHEWVQPVVMDKIRCVAIVPKLQDINPNMFRFLMDFAADNDLRVLTYQELMAEQGLSAQTSSTHPTNTSQSQTESTPLAAPNIVSDSSVSGSEHTSTESPTNEPEKVVIREIEAHETAIAFAALSVLRPKLTDINSFVEQINTIQRLQGYRLLGVFEQGISNPVAVCGFREETNLVSGRHLHIDDLITLPQYRRNGYGTRLLGEIQRIALEKHIDEIHIDSNVGGERTTAHRIYFQHGFEISAYHFVCKTDFTR